MRERSKYVPSGPEADRLSPGFGDGWFGTVGPGWRGGAEVQRGAVTVVGGAGFVGSAIARGATGSGRPVVSVDRVRQLPPRLPASVDQRMVDLLVDPIEMPPGPVVLAAGASDPHAGDAWRLVLDNAVTTAPTGGQGRDHVVGTSHQGSPACGRCSRREHDQPGGQLDRVNQQVDGALIDRRRQSRRPRRTRSTLTTGHGGRRPPAIAEPTKRHRPQPSPSRCTSAPPGHPGNRSEQP